MRSNRNCLKSTYTIAARTSILFVLAFLLVAFSNNLAGGAKASLPLEPPPPPSCTPPPSVMTNWWPGDGNPFDIKGAQHGTLNGGANFAAGKVGQAFNFDGVDDTVTFGNTLGNFGTTDFTIDFWIRTTSTRSEGILGKRTICDTGSFWDILLSGGANAGKLFIELDQDSSNTNLNSFTSNGTVNDGQFHHIALTRQGNTVTLYIDGAFDKSNSTAGTTNISNTAQLTAGRSACTGPSPTTFFLTGQLDEMEFFGRALTLAEMQSLFTASSAGKCRPCTPPPLQMAGWWPADGNTNDIQNGNNGTLQNGATFATGLVGQAFSFDGMDDAVGTSATALNGAYLALTIDAWVFPLSHGQALDGLGRTIISKTEGDGFALRIVNGFIQPDLRLTTGDATPIFNQSALPLNAWSHVTATYDGSTIRAYLNGQQLGSGVAATGTIKNTTNANVCLMLGNDPIPGCAIQSSGFGFHGLIDELEVFTRALTDSEIQSIVNAGSGGKCRPSAPGPCTPAPGQMTNWWPADNHTNDIIGGQNGTLNAGASYISGEVEQAFNFDGVDDFVSFGATAGNFGTSDFTIDFWMRTTTSRDEGVLSKRTICDHASFFDIQTTTGTLAGKLSFEMEQDAMSTNLNSFKSVGTVNDGQFHHIAYVRQGTTVTLYIDGVFDNTNTTAGVTNVSNTAVLTAGRSACTGSSDGTQFFTGQLDEIELFNRALSLSEIQSIVNAGTGGKCHACAVPPSGMVAWYPASGNANDIIGGNTGTPQNGATFAPGRVGQAFKLDGVNDFVSVANNASLDFGTGNFSIDGWIRLNTNGADQHIFTKQADSFPNDKSYFLMYNYLPPNNMGPPIPGLRFVVRDTTGNQNDLLLPVTLYPFTWYHVTAVRQGTTSLLYLNGALLGQQTAGTNVNSGTGGTAAIGYNIETNTRFFNGLIDELELFNRALLPTEIQAIFNAGATGKCFCPGISCPANITVSNTSGECGATVSYTTPTADPGCGTVTCLPASGSFFAKGTTTVTCSTTSGSTCNFTVTVNDTQAPAISCPENIVTNTAPDSCAANVNYAVPVANDNCPNATVICVPAAGSSFAKGTTTVTCTATDTSNNVANCTFTVTVNDTQAPAITCPANITMNESAPGSGSAVVTYPNPTVTDNCPLSCAASPTKPQGRCAPGATSCVPASGSTFAVGTTTVTCTACDCDSNSASCTFTVMINAVASCSINCPANIAVSNALNQCGAVVNYSAPATTGNCGTVTCSPASGSFFPVGTTSVTCTSSAGPSCAFTVTVQDTQPPALTCPANIFVAAAATCPPAISRTVNYTVTASDNCPGVTVVCSPPSGSTFPAGTTSVTCTATDASGNATSCSFTVTVFTACLVDQNNSGNVVLFNALTGDYRFCCNGLLLATGKGVLTLRGCIGTIDDQKGDRKVHIGFDFSANSGHGAGTAALFLGGSTNAKCSITDQNMQDNLCTCPSGGSPSAGRPTK